MKEFPLINFVKRAKSGDLAFNNFNNNILFLNHLIEVINEDGYYFEKISESFDKTAEFRASEMVQFLIQKFHCHLDMKFLKPSIMIHELGYYRASGNNNYYYKTNMFQYNLVEYNYYFAVLNYLISNIKLTTPQDLGWDNWDKIK